MTVADSLLNQAWLRGLREQLDRAPARPRVPLLLAHGDGSEPVAIGSIESASALQLAGAGLALRDDGGAWRIEVPAGATPKAALAAIAHWLHANGLGSAWRGEL